MAYFEYVNLVRSSDVERICSVLTESLAKGRYRPVSSIEYLKTRYDFIGAGAAISVFPGKDGWSVIQCVPQDLLCMCLGETWRDRPLIQLSAVLGVPGLYLSSLNSEGHFAMVVRGDCKVSVYGFAMDDADSGHCTDEFQGMTADGQMIQLSDIPEIQDLERSFCPSPYAGIQCVAERLIGAEHAYWSHNTHENCIGAGKTFAAPGSATRFFVRKK